MNKVVIVNIASDLSVIAPDQNLYKIDGLPDNQQPVKPVSYSVVKTGLIGLTKYLATYWADRNIRVNAICHGLVKTDFSKLLWENPEAEKASSQRMPLRRLGEADDFKGVAVFLASDESSFMTGQALTICGGASMWS